MQHEIRIYGDIVPFKWFNDGTEYDLGDLKTSLDGVPAGTTELVVDIHTFGGNTGTAFGMYNLLKRFHNDKNIQITTRIDGYCASSGVMLLLAGNKRIGNEFMTPFVHNAWTYVMGDKNEVKKVYEELAKVDDQMSQLYAKETTITKEEALNLMNQSRDLTVEECKQYGFITEFENASTDTVLVYNSIRSINIDRRNNLINNNMNKDVKDVLDGIKNSISKFLSPENKKTLFTAENKEMVFENLSEKENISVGDKATVDGKSAGSINNGIHVMADGKTLKFEGDKLTEIVEKDETKDLAIENSLLVEKLTLIENSLKGITEGLEEKTKELIKNALAPLQKESEQDKETIKNLQKENTEAKELLKAVNSIMPNDEVKEEQEDAKKPELTGVNKVADLIKNQKKVIF